MAVGTKCWHEGVEIMGMFDTNAKQVADQMIGRAKGGIENLKRAVQDMEAELELRKPGDSFPIANCSRVVEEALSIYNDVARANGAVLVRSTT